jgi:hypothetical protein
MSHLPPQERLQLLLGKQRYAPNTNVDAAIEASRLKPGQKSPGGGVVAKRYGYRQSLGHIGEDKGYNSMWGRIFVVTDKNKPTNEPGADRGALAFTDKGKLKFFGFDDKAHQKIGRLGKVSALTTNLDKNLKAIQQRWC